MGTQTVLKTTLLSSDVLEYIASNNEPVSIPEIYSFLSDTFPAVTTLSEEKVVRMVNGLMALGVIAQTIKQPLPMYRICWPIVLTTDKRWTGFLQQDCLELGQQCADQIDSSKPLEQLLRLLSLSVTDPLPLHVEAVYVVCHIIGLKYSWTALVNKLSVLAAKKVVKEVEGDKVLFVTSWNENSTSKKPTKQPTVLTVAGPQVQINALAKTTPIDTALLKQVSHKYLDGEVFDLPRLGAECKGLLANVMLNTVQLGRRLCAVKEVLGHGQFMTWLEQESGLPMDQRMVNHYMAIGQAVTERPELARLGGMGVTKAALLLSLPEPQLEEMATQGTLNGQPLDELETKTRKELLLHLRTMKKQVTEAKEVKEKAIEEVETLRVLLNDAQQKLGEAVMRTPAQVDQDLRADMAKFQGLVSAKLNYYKALNPSKLEHDTLLMLLALGDFVGNCAEAMVLTHREKMGDIPALSRHGGVTGQEWNDLEARQKANGYWQD